MPNPNEMGNGAAMHAQEKSGKELRIIDFNGPAGRLLLRLSGHDGSLPTTR